MQECKICVEGEAGDADDGQGAGFGGDDGERDRPPGYVAVGQEVVAQAALRFAEAQSEDRDRRQIERNDRQVERVEPVDANLRFESASRVDESCEGACLQACRKGPLKTPALAVEAPGPKGRLTGSKCRHG